MTTTTPGGGALDRRELANAIRALSMDAVQAANSGHPGAPMGMAEIATVLWREFLKHNPANPEWADRDRFVLSNGHGSMLLYSLLHLTGYPLPIEQIRNFRQLGAHTAGHPERDLHIGIETTTGPLGQGITNAVGMAIAEQHLAATFNREGHNIVDHRTWVFLGDGCLMEGISHEACSLAGTLKLGKLICLYDDNGISIDGDVEGWFTDDTQKRFEAYGWQVIAGVDGHDPAALAEAIAQAEADGSHPSLIICKTTIGAGAPNKQGTAATHGAPLGDDEIAATRAAIGWPHPPFHIPDDIAAAWDQTEAGVAREAEWKTRFGAYAAAYPELAKEFERRMAQSLPVNWTSVVVDAIEAVQAAAADMATRKASLAALNALAPALPELIGGSADLTGSNLTFHNDSATLDASHPGGNYINYGVREFGMTAIANGLLLHGGVRAYTGTFLTFSDYSRNAIRMAALMEIPNICVFTHDSIGLGEDGPTHQPVEHVASLRLMPNLNVWRPCDTLETLIAWQHALEQTSTPSALVFTRQSLPFVSRRAEQIAGVVRGGYAIQGGDAVPELVLIATGSEVALALSAAQQLSEDGVAVRVVSMPCTEVFDAQDETYRRAVLGEPGTPRLAIEAGSPDGWWKYVGDRGDVLGMKRYGESAPAGQLFEKYGFSVSNVAKRALALLGR
ncbi:MAG: transketolase [Pseudomonadota bacterium]